MALCQKLSENLCTGYIIYIDNPSSIHLVVIEFPQLAYSEQTCLPSDTFQPCTLLVCSSGNAQLGCLPVPTRTDAEVSLFVHRMSSEGWLVQ